MSFIKLSDAILHYKLQGRGEPVLFIQGCGVTGSGWKPQTDISQALLGLELFRGHRPAVSCSSQQAGASAQ